MNSNVRWLVPLTLRVRGDSSPRGCGCEVILRCHVEAKSIKLLISHMSYELIFHVLAPRVLHLTLEPLMYPGRCEKVSS